jgi:peptidyl-prolyl cis-trans isomerase SurA
MRFVSIRVLPVLLAAALGLLVAVGAAAQQGVRRVAAIVNDDVISIYDLEMRLRLVMRSARLDDNPENRRRLANQVLRSLVDERLQLQEAAKSNITASDADFQRAFRFLEQQNGIPSGRFEDFIKSEGVDRDTLMTQLRADIVWNKLLLARMRSSAEISDEEIDEALRQIQKDVGKGENLVSEIFLPVDTPDQEDEVRRTAQRLVEQMRAGAAFAAVARQFSRGAAAAMGGDVGWVIPGQLTEEVDRVAQQLPLNQVSEPIRTIGGFYLIQVRDRRQGVTPGAATTMLELKQILLHLAPTAQASEIEQGQALARTIQQSIEGCDNVEEAGKRFNTPDAGSLGKVRMEDIPESFRQAVTAAPVGKFVGPVRTNSGLHLLMVCSREAAQAPGLPSREQISERLMQRRLSMFSRRYLRDLRRTAIVELR